LNEDTYPIGINSTNPMNAANVSFKVQKLRNLTKIWKISQKHLNMIGQNILNQIN